MGSETFLNILKIPYKLVNYRLYATIKKLHEELIERRGEIYLLHQQLISLGLSSSPSDEREENNEVTKRRQLAAKRRQEEVRTQAEIIENEKLVLRNFLDLDYRNAETPLDVKNLSENDKAEIRSKLEKMSPWFSYFNFGAEIHTPLKPSEAAETTGKDYFELRCARLFDRLEQVLDPKESTLLDVGCSDGFFSIEAARRGYKEVVGVDVRDESIQRAQYAAQLFGLDNVKFEVGSIYELNCIGDRKFDAVVSLGLFYHLSDPARALERLFSASKNVGLVGSWTAHGMQETFTLSSEDPERYLNGDRPILVIPSNPALRRLMELVGYINVEEILRPGIAAEADMREYIGRVPRLS